MSERLVAPVPNKPMSLDEVIAGLPMVRHSLMAKFDDCPLSCYFELKLAQGWSTHPQARGTIFHRFAAEALREMKRQDSKGIPKGVALAILEEVLEQRDVHPTERVRVPLREIPLLRMAASKFAKDNEFTIRNIVDVEKRLTAPLSYVDDEGTIRERMLTGQLDVLVADRENDKGAIVIDWKDTWGLPPERKADDRDAAEAGLSYHGFFQQRFYGWLVMKTYRDIDKVTLREFYPRRSKARPAAIYRKDLERVEKELSNIVLELDRCLASGKPKKLEFPDVAPWNPQPGKHCFYCVAGHRCPIEVDAREAITVRTPDEARDAVARLQVAEAVRKSHRGALRPYVDEHGPQEAKDSKGRLVFGLRTNKSGEPELRFFVPEDADRAPARQPEDKNLEDAMKRSIERAKAEKVSS